MDKQITRDFSIYLLTWNVVVTNPLEDLKDALGITDEADPDSLPDCYAFGLQEVNAKPHAVLVDAVYDDPWNRALKALLGPLTYVKVRSIRMQGLVLTFFVKRKHIGKVRDIQTRWTRTGLGGTWGNKGAVTLRMNLYGSSICIVNSHLAAHDKEIQQRIQDYYSIVDGQVFDDPETENILFHDYVFWVGDLNFRLNEFSAAEIKTLIESGDYDKLLASDQLASVRRQGLAFSELDEKTPNFPPTYKYHINKQSYDLKRRPAWTDRIMYKMQSDVYENAKLDIQQIFYRSHQSYIQSDHKPVTALFNIKVFSEDIDSMGVVFQPISDWTGNPDKFTLEYMVQGNFTPSEWDWIGLYAADFNSLQSYIAYIWAAPVHQCNPEGTFKLTFPLTVSLPQTSCRLLYMTPDWTGVLGMSEPFTVSTAV